MSLTPRQLEVLMLYAMGLRRPEIAALLHLQPVTVDSHMENIRARLGSRSIAHSIVVAVSREMLVIDFVAETVVLPAQDLIAV